MHSPRKRWAPVTLMIVLAMGFTLVFADGGAQHQVKQTPPVQMGTSGGNINDITRRFCCSGTLGSLVSVGSTQYILSNNHILALSGTGTVGDDISQPGLVDSGCSSANSNIVADLFSVPAVGANNVDAALATVRSGQVDTTGAILDVGVPSATTASPTVGESVAKSGRTTGLTCGTVTAINGNFRVQYQVSCGKGKKFTVTYTNQVVVSGSGFSAGGDSGSLIVTAGQARPLALLFAGSSTTTIGNPVGDVVNAFPGLTFVGGGDHAVTGCGAAAPAVATAPARGQSAEALERARNAKEQYARSLMMDDAVMGVAVGLGDDGNPAVVIFVEEGREHGPLPQSLNGVPVKVVRTDTI